MEVIKVTQHHNPGCGAAGGRHIIGLFHDIQTAIAAANKDAEKMLIDNGALIVRPKSYSYRETEYTWSFAKVEVGTYPAKTTYLDYHLTIGDAWDRLAAKLAEPPS